MRRSNAACAGLGAWYRAWLPSVPRRPVVGMAWGDREELHGELADLRAGVGELASARGEGG